MLTCNSCMRRCLQAIIGDSLSLSASAAAPLYSPSTKRAFSSTARSTAEYTQGRQNRREQWLDSRGTRPAGKPKPAPDDERSAYVVRKHLAYLQDPLKLATFVRNALRNDEYETTLDVVRTASKSIECVVSWNHLIDYTLSRGRMNDAIKIYNEMKKRAQVPDGHTYTIIFRGCAEHPDSKAAVQKVLTIYQSMMLDKSPIKPNAIHMNALLKVCARAHDMDALFTVAAKMPTSGMGAPDNLTYTTIINAVRMHASGDGGRDKVTPMQLRRYQEQALLKARHLWADVINRWRNGDIWIDEELVCAMGRILLMGDRGDLDDVFSLIEQTMNIPRLHKRLVSPPALEGARQEKVEVEAIPFETEEENAAEEPSKAEPFGPQSSIANIDYFEHVTPVKAPSGASSGYAKPGRNALSLVLKAILNIRLHHVVAPLKEEAFKYWSTFTEQHGVKPDPANYHDMLRILRVARASTDTVELLRMMPRQDLEPKVFKIAMSTCIRDKLNPNAFNNAGKILDLMQMAMKVPVVSVLDTYLEVAVAAPALGSSVTSKGKRSPSKGEQGDQILRALERIQPNFINIKSLLAYSDPSRPMDVRKTYELIDDTIAFVRRMIGALDLLMNRALVPREMYGDLTGQRAKLAAYVTRFKHGRADKVETTRSSDHNSHEVQRGERIAKEVLHREAQEALANAQFAFGDRTKADHALIKASLPKREREMKEF